MPRHAVSVGSLIAQTRRSPRDLGESPADVEARARARRSGYPAAVQPAALCAWADHMPTRLGWTDPPTKRMEMAAKRFFVWLVTI